MEADRYLDQIFLMRLRRMAVRNPDPLDLHQFLANTPRRLRAAFASLDTGKLRTVERAAAGVAEQAGKLGALSLRDLAERIEELASAGRADEIGPLLRDLEGAFDRILACVEQERTARQA